jgi:hypothetical protein
MIQKGLSMKSLLKCLSVLALAPILLNAPARAQTRQSALNVTNINPSEVRQETSTLGWAFTVETNVVLQSLGIFVPLGTEGGFGGTGSIGLWSAHDAQLLAGFNVGFEDPITNHFRYHGLDTPLTLQAGTEYVVGVYYPNYEFQVMATLGIPATAPGIHFVEFRQLVGSGGMPTRAFTPQLGLLGPNFQFTPVLTSAAAPEPGTLGLSLVGGLMFVSRRRRARTVKTPS